MSCVNKQQTNSMRDEHDKSTITVYEGLDGVSGAWPGILLSVKTKQKIRINKIKIDLAQFLCISKV